MDYHTDDGINLIQEWYDAQEAAVQVAFDYTLQEILGTEELTGFRAVQGSDKAACGALGNRIGSVRG